LLRKLQKILGGYFILPHPVHTRVKVRFRGLGFSVYNPSGYTQDGPAYNVFRYFCCLQDGPGYNPVVIHKTVLRITSSKIFTILTTDYPGKKNFVARMLTRTCFE